MSETTRIALTAATTILGGILIFAVSQLIQKFVLDPVNEQRKVIGEIDFCLIYRAWAYANPQEGPTPDRDQAADELRKCAGRLIASTNAVRAYKLARYLGARDQAEVKEAAKHLIGLSNSVYLMSRGDPQQQGRRSSEDAQKICHLLGLTLRPR